MQKLILAQANDLPSLGKSLRRCQIEMENPIINECELPSLIDDGRVMVLKDGAKILSFLVLNPFPMDVLFPNSIKSQEDFLYDIGYFGEPLILLQAIFTDPMYRHKGYASLLFSSFCSARKHATIFALLPSVSKETLPFFETCGFSVKGIGETNSLILVRKKKKEGLCSDPSF